MVYDKNGKVIKSSRQIKSSFNYYDGFEDDVAFFAERYSDNDDIVEMVAGDIEDDHPTESPEEFDSLMRAVHEELKRQGYFKQPWQVNSSKETITSNKEPADMDMAYQLEGYIESDGELYTQMIVPVIKNLERKVKKGVYDYDKSLILWQHVADEGAKHYVQELGGPAYNVATRKEVAKKLSSYYEENYMGDNPIESSKQIKSGIEIYKGAKFKNPNGSVIEIVRKDDDGYVLFKTYDGRIRDTTEESAKRMLQFNQYTPIESSKQIKSAMDFPQDGNEFANLIDKVLDEHHIGNSGAYFIPRKNVFEVDIDGDWKHDHLAADHLLFQELGLSCIDTREIGDSDSDWYEAVHTYQRNSDIEDLHKRMADIFKNIESSKKNINSSWEEDVDFVVDQFMDEWMEKHPDSTTEECAAARKKYHDWVYERV